MNRWTRSLLLAAWAVVLAPPAAAHSELEKTVPAAGSATRESPARLSLWFSQRFEPAFSRIRVLNAQGEQVDNGDAHVDRVDAHQFNVSLPRLAPGTYSVQWRVLSADTHVSEGGFTFDVSP